MNAAGSALQELRKVILDGGSPDEIRAALVAGQEAGMSKQDLTVHLERIRAANEVQAKDEEIENRAMAALDMVSGWAWASRLEWPETSEDALRAAEETATATKAENARLRRAIRDARGLMDDAMQDDRPGLAHHKRISADRILGLALGENPSGSAADADGGVDGVRASELETILFDQLLEEIARQDAKHGPFTGSPLGAPRLAIACLEDEVREVLDAWRKERKVSGMPQTREELMQVAAVALRAVRDLWGSR